MAPGRVEPGGHIGGRRVAYVKPYPPPEEKRGVGTVRLEASAHTIAPSLLPSLSYDSLDSLIHSDHRCQSFPPAETVYPRFSPFKLLFWRVQLRNVVLTVGPQSRPTFFV